ncbi:MAG: hypothetical protein U0228_15870 [Myxococcaceae bacterium]
MKRVSFLLLLAGAVLLCGCPDPTMMTDACKGRTAGDLVITEIMIDPESTDTGGEWVEVFNTLGTPVDLKGLTLYTRDTDGTNAKSTVIKAGSVPARSYFTMGDIRSGPNPMWINYTYADALGSFGNTRGVVGLKCGTTTLAEFTWNSVAKPNRSRMLNGLEDPNPTLAAVEANYCDTPVGTVYFGNNAGTPGAKNPQCQPEATTGTCIDNGAVRAMTPPGPGDLVITEVMTRPAASSSANGEWLEVLARASVDLNDLVISATGGDTRITNMNCLRVQPGDYLLMARSGDTFVNGGLPTPDHVYASLSFADTTNQRIALIRGDAGIDEIAITPAMSGHAWQLDPLKLDPVSNDDPANFCPAPTKWNPDGGGDYGSPRVANPACAVPTDPNTCLDTGTSQMRAVVNPNYGDIAFTEWMSAPSTPQADKEWLEVVAKSNFDLNGLTLVVGTNKVPLASGNCLPVTANTYLVFGKNPSPAANGNLPPLTASFSAALTSTSVFSLLGADGGIYDTVQANGEYAAAATQVAPGNEDPDLNDQLTVRCKAPNKWDGGTDFGSPGQPNPACTTDAGSPSASDCFDLTSMTTRPARRPADGTVVITEWMPNPAAVADTAGEYFEVLVTQDTDLNGLTLQVGTSKTVLASPNCMAVTANSYLVFAKNASSALNGNLPTVTAVFTGSLTDSAQTITVLGVDGGTYDTISYTGATGTAAWPSGASMEVKPGFETPANNDIAANLCVTPATNRYGVPDPADGGLTGDRGTPGLPNVCP